MFGSKHTYPILSLIGILLIFSPLAQARPGRDRVVWTQKANNRTGLYTTKNYFVSHGVSLSFAGMYYFGDADNEGVAFHGGFNPKNLSLGGGLGINYTLPLGNHCNMRFGAMGGTLRGDNTAKFQSLPEPREDYRKFHSWFIQPAVGVEYYPFSQAGFFIYGGLAVTASIIDKFEFYYYSHQVIQEKPLTGKTYGILPMVQVGLGYTWQLAEGWTLSLEAMVHEGLVDAHYMNLDAFPLDASQNSEGVALGSVGGKWTDANGVEHIHWNDGWFQVGFTISYRWRNCETCRNSHNYGNMKVGRRSR